MFAKTVSASNKISTVPAPIGGLNARDSLAAMPETDAIRMLNLWPQPYGVAVRKGYKEWATGMPTAIPTIAQWADRTGALKFFAWSGDSLFDVTVAGSVGAALLSGLTNSYWQTTMLVNAAGAHLLSVNGADDGIEYAGSINRLVLGDGIVPYTWKNLDPKDAIQLTVHQKRLWAVEVDSAVGWYLPPDAIYGELDGFDFGPLFSRGGGLAYLTTWTIDDGDGATDQLVAASTEGEVAVYAGTDPTDADKWALVGVYFVGAPVAGRRSYAKVGGDLYILTQQGVVSLADLLTSTKQNPQAITFKSDKIQFLISELIGAYSTAADWQLNFIPKLNMLLVNVPTIVSGGNTQLVCNQLISSWAQFGGMDAVSWGILDSQPYFGDYNGTLWLAWDGNVDGADVAGANGTSIVTEVQQAYSYLNALGQQKQVGMYRPNFIVSSAVLYTSSIDYDFISRVLEIPGGVPVVDADLWDTALWDHAQWYGGATDRHWNQADGLGVAASIHMKIAASGEALWVSTDYSFKVGGLL